MTWTWCIPEAKIKKDSTYTRYDTIRRSCTHMIF